jgi:ribosome small subunit-dependent GTPase A
LAWLNVLFSFGKQRKEKLLPLHKIIFMAKGRVILSTGAHYTVMQENETQHKCCIRGNFRLKGSKSTNPIAVGDWVEFILPQENQDGVITKLYERQNTLTRRATKLSKRSHIIASNIDKAFLITCLSNPETPLGFIDRFLCEAESQKIKTVIVFNKIDLYNREIRAKADRVLEIYRSIGYTCIEVSALKGTNIDILKEKMRGQTCLFSGNSGVGKSALLNAIDPALALKTEEISSKHLKGKHTTTFAQMFRLSFGCDVIDTPGIKEFGMFDFKKEEIGLYFTEMKARLSGCQYYNCKHESEPNCAIKQAVKDGEISIERYTNYLNIMHGEELTIKEWEDR